MQPIIIDNWGTLRFSKNRIVEKLIETHPTMGYTEISIMYRNGEFNQAEIEQVWQQIGYSVSGYGDLSFVSTHTIALADEMADNVLKGIIEDEKDVKIRVLETRLKQLEDGIKEFFKKTIVPEE